MLSRICHIRHPNRYVISHAERIFVCIFDKKIHRQVHILQSRLTFTSASLLLLLHVSCVLLLQVSLCVVASLLCVVVAAADIYSLSSILCLLTASRSSHHVRLVLSKPLRFLA
jgi:uncharacterized membrane protein